METTTATDARTILVVDDDAIQLKHARRRLIEAGYEVTTASGAEEALAQAVSRPPAAVISDIVMGDIDGYGLCRRLREQPCLAHVPIVLASAHYGGPEGIELARRVGASTLVQRSATFEVELAALARCLGGDAAGGDADGGSIEEHLRLASNQVSRLARVARSAEERYRTLFEHANGALTVLSLEGVILEANRRWTDILGIPPEQLVGRHIRDLGDPGTAEANLARYQELSTNRYARADAVALRRADGEIIFMEFSNTTVELDGQPCVLSIGQEVTEQIRAAQTLAAAERNYRSLVERIPDVVWSANALGELTYVAPNVVKILGYTADEMRAEDLEAQTSQVHPDDRARVAEAYRGALCDGKAFDIEYRRRRKDGGWALVHNRTTETVKDGFQGIMSDVTEQRRLEQNLRQSQKMEAIGQLTGGVAHDFNNILATVLGNSHFLLEDLPDGDPRREDADEIRKAAERAAALTRQLLAFSRRQVLDPSVLDLNGVVHGLEKMLRRLIGEDVDFAVETRADLGTVVADAGQLEQVIMNLVLNARDAMPTGGQLTIETANAEFDEAYVAGHAPAVAGRYVMLAVSDTGCGMDAETQRRAFEPFFTTKGLGRGTGLGLSTCYGIVKQSGGFIWLYSEAGRGTTFKVYLPRNCAPSVEERPAAEAASGRRGSETVLLVEDDERVRSTVQRILVSRGYRVLVAADAHDALAMATATDAIDLVVSDVVMPILSGPELVGRIAAARAGRPFRTLYMSGYSDHAILRSGVLHSDASFIQKPFPPDALARKVREVLDA
jgi:PAS domain S-box-containing protein